MKAQALAIRLTHNGIENKNWKKGKNKEEEGNPREKKIITEEQGEIGKEKSKRKEEEKRNLGFPSYIPCSV